MSWAIRHCLFCPPINPRHSERPRYGYSFVDGVGKWTPGTPCDLCAEHDRDPRLKELALWVQKSGLWVAWLHRDAIRIARMASPLGKTSVDAAKLQALGPDATQGEVDACRLQGAKAQMVGQVRETVDDPRRPRRFQATAAQYEHLLTTSEKSTGDTFQGMVDRGSGWTVIWRATLERIQADPTSRESQAELARLISLCGDQ